MLTIYQLSACQPNINLSSLIDPEQQQLKYPQSAGIPASACCSLLQWSTQVFKVGLKFYALDLNWAQTPCRASQVSCLDNYSLSFKPPIFLTMNPKCGEWWSCFPRSVLLLFGFNPTQKDIKTNQLKRKKTSHPIPLKSLLLWNISF